MTGNEVIQAIKLALDKYSASASAVIGPAFLDEELCAFANQAMVETICTKFTGHNQLQQGFEQSVKRISDLEKLIVERTSILIRQAGTNRFNTTDSAQFTADDLLFLVSVRIKLTTKDVVTYLPAELIDRQTSSRFEQTPTNRPYIPIPKVITSVTSQALDGSVYKGLTVFLDPDTPVINSKIEIVTEHVKLPKRLHKDDLATTAFAGLLPEPVVYEIINKAALLALDNIESQRTEVKASLNNTQE